MLLGLAVVSSVLMGCRNDDSPIEADSDSDSGGSGGESETGPATTGDDSGGGPCMADDDCDSGDPCQAGTCEDDGTCSFAPLLSNECRPQIDVEFPPRAATLDGSSPTVTVVGTVTSGAGEIQWLTLNGEDVEVQPDGSFTHDVTATVGGNMLVFETIDDAEFERRRVQSYLWSPQYRTPVAPPQDIVPEGIAIYLGQESLDDDDSSLPLDDLASLFELAFGSAFDLGGIADPNTPLATVAGYEVTLQSFGIDATQVDLNANDWGMELRFDLIDTAGALDFTCVEQTCQILGDGSGSIGLDQISVGGTLLMQVTEDHQLQMGLVDVETDLSGLEIDTSNDVLNFLTEIIEPVVEIALFPLLEQTLEDQIQQQLDPLLQQGLGDLGLNTTFPLPNPANPDDPIMVELATDFQRTAFHDGQAPPSPSPAQGGALILRAGAFVGDVPVPYENLGIPSRAGCGTGEESIAMPRNSALELGLADDFVNQILYATWAGGLLELPLGEVFGGGDDGGGLPVGDLNIDLSGMLAPTASDCGNRDQQLLVYIGDLQVTASLTFTGQPIDFVAYISLAMELDITASEEEGLGFGFGDVTAIETELTIEQDASIELEGLIIGLLESQLTGGLLGDLAGGGFGGIELPAIDLSEQLGLEPGTAVVGLQLESAERVPGTTVLGGRLGPPPPPEEDPMP